MRETFDEREKEKEGKEGKKKRKKEVGRKRWKTEETDFAGRWKLYSIF